MLCDISSRESIEKFVREFLEKYNRLDVLINNAGVEFARRQLTLDGFESSIGVNYLDAFLLTEKLLPVLKNSAPSRVINLSSGLLKQGRIDFFDLQGEKKYDAMKVYSNAKLMVLLWSYELACRLDSSGVTVNAVQPGFAATNLEKNSGSFMNSIMFSLVRPMQINAKKAAETSVYLASSSDVEGVSGKCFSDKKEITTSLESYDAEKQKRLWDTTIKLLTLHEN